MNTYHWQLLQLVQVRGKSQAGQTMAEYGSLIAVIAVIVVLAAPISPVFA